jgi:hypothetical protein
MSYSLKQKAGAAVIDWPRFELYLRHRWTQIRNRRERLRRSSEGPGVECEWQWTSDLHVAKVFPTLGTRLMRRALRDWPIAFADAPHDGKETPQLSFIIGHRGSDRIPYLLATIGTIDAQCDVRCECIVVEQSAYPEVAPRLPSWVRYLHTAVGKPSMPYCRAWALNAGARIAKGKLLVLHDGDMLVPQAYARELWVRYEAGFEVLNLKRFVFYLDRAQSVATVSTRQVSLTAPPEAVVQNLEAGGSVAIAADAFFAIGGYDESFVGWGGEDNEFWERAHTLRIWPFGYLPIAHLWHAPQAGKALASSDNAGLYRHRSGLPVAQRIAELRERRFGDTHATDPPWSPAAQSS